MNINYLNCVPLGSSCIYLYIFMNKYIFKKALDYLPCVCFLVSFEKRDVAHTNKNGKLKISKNTATAK